MDKVIIIENVMASSRLNDQLIRAIQKNKISDVQSILAECDSTGIPYADINHEPVYITALLYAISIGHNVPICRTLLNVRDDKGDPVIYLIKPTVSRIISSNNYTSQEKRELIYAILNLRYSSNGRLYYPIQAEPNVIINAAEAGDVDIVKLLLDLRTQNGFFAVDVEAIHSRENDTALDRAQEEYKKYLSSSYREIIALLTEAIDESKQMDNSFNPPRPKRFVEREPFTPAIERHPEAYRAAESLTLEEKRAKLEAQSRREIRQFQSNLQSTHAPAVEASVRLSLEKLKARYEKSLTEERITKNLESIKAYLTQDHSISSEKRVIILKSYERICSLTDRHPAVGLTPRQVLSLIWEGVVDPEARSSGQPLSESKATSSVIQLRKASLADKLYEVHSEYDGIRAACPPGTINQIVNALNEAHPDVQIFQIDTAMSAAVTEHAMALMLKALEKQTPDKQKSILKFWKEDIADIKDSKEDRKDVELTVSKAFHDQTRSHINSKLKDYYQNLLTQPMLNGITGSEAYRAFPVPILHKPLQDILAEIETINPEAFRLKEQKEEKEKPQDPFIKIVQTRSALHGKLQLLFGHAALEDKEDHLKPLKEVLAKLLKLKKANKNIELQYTQCLTAINEQLAILKKHILESHKETPSLFSDIEKILEKNLVKQEEDVLKTQLNAKIAEKALLVFTTERSFDEDLIWLNKYYKKYKKIIQHFEKIDSQFAREKKESIVALKWNSHDLI